ncbi:hypothetical protein NCAS_0F00900 [Naumovozyma castellii]|uniref:C2H2-type domain-containing protein n=1 Tax=Naumovozyma castellii TaxID=27288 RepID=G0VGF4_NAUCA|nr:hypothetical protein NCAS_0F00900 [Naumovozyma castellii CBS 4309]CCC70574.1 hypothetical protein NCAS_0F00900 [Naumovozyma castellii CBS 4309]
MSNWTAYQDQKVKQEQEQEQEQEKQNQRQSQMTAAQKDTSTSTSTNTNGVSSLLNPPQLQSEKLSLPINTTDQMHSHSHSHSKNDSLGTIPLPQTSKYNPIYHQPSSYMMNESDMRRNYYPTPQQQQPPPQQQQQVTGSQAQTNTSPFLYHWNTGRSDENQQQQQQMLQSLPTTSNPYGVQYNVLAPDTLQMYSMGQVPSNMGAYIPYQTAQQYQSVPWVIQYDPYSTGPPPPPPPNASITNSPPYQQSYPSQQPQQSQPQQYQRPVSVSPNILPQPVYSQTIKSSLKNSFNGDTNNATTTTSISQPFKRSDAMASIGTNIQQNNNNINNSRDKNLPPISSITTTVPTTASTTTATTPPSVIREPHSNQRFVTPSPPRGTFDSENAVYICHICSKNFKRRSWLKRHLLSHSSERHYFCPWCLSRHKRRDNLLQHMKLKHSKNLINELKFRNVIFDWHNYHYQQQVQRHQQYQQQGGMPPQIHGANEPFNINSEFTIRTLVTNGVVNKEDVKRVLNQLVDENENEP